MTAKVKTCEICGGAVGKGRVKYCSEVCMKTAERRAINGHMMTYRNRQRMLTAPVCVVCGAKSNRGMYCSRECELKQQRKSYGEGVYTIRELLKRERG